MRISKQPCPAQIMTDQKQLEKVEYFNYLGCMTTNDARHTYEIKSRNAMVEAAFNKKTLFTSKLDLNFRKKLVKCDTWSIALCGPESCTFQKADQKYLESFDM